MMCLFNRTGTDCSRRAIACLLACACLVSNTSRGQDRAEKMTGKPRIKVAAVQLAGYDKGELPREGYSPVDRVVKFIGRAGEDHADLVVFPEYVLGHIAVPGEETKRIAAAAREAHAYVAVGCWELHDGKLDGSISNTILLFDRRGAIAGRYHKTHAAIDHFDGEPPWLNPPRGKTRRWFLKNDPEWTMEQGKRLPVFTTDFGKVGMITCYDGWFPEPARVLSLKGAELILWLNGRRGAVEDFIVKTTMFQSHVAMVTTNQAYGAGTMIGDWPTRIVATAPPRQEAYILGEVNLAQVRKSRANSRNFRRRRPDLYGDLVEPLPQQSPPVKFAPENSAERSTP